MESVFFLAQTLGFTLVIITLSLLLNPKKIKNIINSAKNDNYLFCFGAVRVFLGVVMLLNYNSWDFSWKMLITILGWLLLLSGIFLLYLPHIAIKLITKLEEKNWISSILTGIILLGCALIYFSFTA